MDDGLKILYRKKSRLSMPVGLDINTLIKPQMRLLELLASKLSQQCPVKGLKITWTMYFGL